MLCMWEALLPKVSTHCIRLLVSRSLSSDVLRRHEKSHQNDSPPSQGHAEGETTVLTPLSPELPNPIPGLRRSSFVTAPPPRVPDIQRSHDSSLQPVDGMDLHDPILQADSSSWFLGANLDLNALDFSLSSAISEWAQIPPMPSPSNFVDPGTLSTSTPTFLRAIPAGVRSSPADSVKEKWFTRLSGFRNGGPNGPSSKNCCGLFGQGNIVADESYRADLSQRLQPRMHDGALPSSEQLNLFAKLYFSRFHPLFPVVHAPSFKPTLENSLLFISICSVGSLFVGSSYAIAQGLQLFERLNKAILASWESILANSCSDALYMVQAGILGQTYAVLSGRPKDLVLADVLHGTVMAWARESNKNALPSPISPDDVTWNGINVDEQWSRWIDHEQRRRVEIALNIHDAELASLLHHEPIRKHRLSHYPHLASDALFMAPTASSWAQQYKQSSDPSPSPGLFDDPLQDAGGDSKFGAYAVLESIHAFVIEARRSSSFNEHESKRLSNLLMRWWRRHSVHFVEDEDEDPFSLPVLWHSVYMAIYADMDLLERASGRDGLPATTTAHSLIRPWANSLDASKCLVHALLVQRYLERMRVSSEPAIHVPRGLFHAALSWLCFTRIGGQQTVNLKAFDAPEIQLLGSDTALHEAHGQAFGDSTFADVNHLHRLIDLLNRVGRWAISSSFSSVLCAAIEGSDP